MTKELKLGAQFRDASFSSVEIRADGGQKKLALSASSTEPYQRIYGTEVLSHDSKSIRMDRFQRSAVPLLFNHNWDDAIGMVTGARIENNRLMVDAQPFDTQRANEVLKMVEGGLRNVSIGYHVHEFSVNEKTDTYTATDWEPLEVSIVTVPADATVGIGRSQELAPVSVRVNVAQPAAQAAFNKETEMAETQAAAGVSAVQVIDNGMQERLRITTINKLCAQHKISEEQRDAYIGDGKSAEEVATAILDVIAERAKNSVKPTELDLSKGDTQKFSLMRAVMAAHDKNWSKAGFEAECSKAIAQRLGTVPDPHKFYVPLDIQRRQTPAPADMGKYGLQKRDLGAASGSAGGYLVGTANQSFIELLRNRSVAFNMGARSLSGLTGNVTIPRQTGAGTAYWLANETTAATESQQTFGQLSLTPKTVGAYTEISRQLALQSSPDAEGLVNADLAAVVALAVDTAVLNGSGASGQPTGIINTAGIGSVTGTSIAYAGILEFQTDTAGSNALFGSSGYVTTPAVAALLMQRVKFTSTASPIWEGNVLDGSITGLRAMASNQLPSANLLFGAFDQVIVGEWGVLEVEVNPYANFAAGIMGVRAMYSVDVGVRYAAAFSLATSVT